VIGPGRAVVVGLQSDGERLEAARRIGAWETLAAEASDPVTAVRELTGGDGADLVIEATADSGVVPQAIGMVRQGGTVIMAGSGYRGKPVTFEPWNVVRDEITLRGTEGFTRSDYLNALSLIERGKMGVEHIVSAEMPLSRINDACEMARDKRAIKIVLKTD